ncbi:hypothetical protein C9426_31920 [Serratia sp. S1B]|nr:hypothetical protein C9426_31920 [Serratia sp. S1B]
MLIISEIETLEDLKTKGSFNEVKADINELIPIKARGWEHLWKKILELRNYAKYYDLVHSAIFFKTDDVNKIEKYLWLVTASRRKYNFYISSKYEGIDYFKREET